MIIKSILIWLLGYPLLSKIIKYFQSSILGKKHDFGLNKILVVVLFLFQISLLTPYNFELKDLALPASIIFSVHLLIFLVKEFYFNISSKFDTQFKLISEIVSIYNSPAIYGFSKSLKPETIQEYVRVYLYWFALFILIALFILLHLTYGGYVFETSKNKAFLFIFLGIVLFPLWIRILSKARECFTSETFSKQVLTFFLFDLLQTFSLLIALIYAIKVINAEEYIVNNTIIISCVIFSLFVVLPFLSDRRRAINANKENDGWLIKELRFLKSNLNKGDDANALNDTLVQLKSRRDNIYNTQKYVRFFLYKLNGLENEIKFEEDFDENEIKSQRKKVMYNTFVKKDNERLELAILRKSKDLVIPLRHFAYLDYFIRELEKIDTEHLSEKIKEWIDKINNIDPERFMFIIDAKSNLDKALHLLGENNLKEAIEVTLNSEIIDNRMILQFKRRYQELNKKRYSGIMSESDDTIQFNKLSFDMISFVAETRKKIK